MELKHAEPETRWRYMPALDGVRGLAVLGVLLYHFKTHDHVAGGLFGVDVFFVLSGFLITGLLVSEGMAAGKVDLLRFYRHRVLRIMPALLAFLAAYTAIVILLHPTAGGDTLSAHEALKNVAFALSYGYNWAVNTGDVVPGGYAPLWSLAVEEQFYLVWPVLVWALLRGGVRPSIMLLLAASLAFLSASLPLFHGWQTDEFGWRRLSAGTDYRVHSLLIGSCAGIAYAAGYVRVEHVKSLPFRAMTLAAVLIVLALVFKTEEDTFRDKYRLVFPGLSLAAAGIVLAVAFVDRGVWRLLLANPVIAHVGRRSYAIYLWHFPIGEAFRHFGMLEQLVLAGALTLAIAEVSHWLVERPALRLRTRRKGSDAANASAPEGLIAAATVAA